MGVLETEPCLNRLPAEPRESRRCGVRSRGRSGACLPAATPQASRDLFPKQGQAGLTDSGTFRCPSGGPAETDCPLCSGVTILQWPVLELLHKCPHSCASVISGIGNCVPSLTLCYPAADEILTSSLYPRPWRGESAHPCARQSSAGFSTAGLSWGPRSPVVESTANRGKISVGSIGVRTQRKTGLSV